MKSTRLTAGYYVGSSDCLSRSQAGNYHEKKSEATRKNVTHKPVLAELLPRLAVTAELTLIAGLMALALGVASGLASARLRGRMDWFVRGMNGLLMAIPNFVFATLIVLLAGLYFPELGIFNYTPFFTDPLANIGSMLLPAMSLALAVSVTISENTPAAVLEVASQD